MQRGSIENGHQNDGHLFTDSLKHCLQSPDI